jgi:putative membrane protein
MTASQSNLAGLSRFIFRAPSWYRSVTVALLLAAVAGVGAFETQEAEQVWRGVLFVGRDAWEGIFFIGIPTVVAGLGTAGVDRYVGGKLSPDRSMLLALACEVVIVAVLAIAATVAYLTPLGQRFVFDALVIALASVFALRLLVVMAVSRSSLPVAAIPASLQTLTAAVLLFVYSGTLRLIEFGGPVQRVYLLSYFSRASSAPAELSAISLDHFLVLGLTSVLYAGTTWGFLYVVDRPWRESMGVSVLDFLQGFIGHIAEGSRELEDFFEDLGEEAVVPVTVLSVAGENGAEKARWVLPMIHPGPMGEIGGGNLPLRVTESVDGIGFPPHATAGHDFNLVTEREVARLLEAAERAHDKLIYTDQATQSVRAESGEASILGQAFGDDAMLVSTFAPGFADDIEYAVGLSAAAEARTSGLDDVLLADAHNSNDGLDGADLGHVTPGSSRSFDMMSAAGETGDRLSTAPESELSVGVGHVETQWEPEDGVGPLGVRVMVTEVEDQRTAYILVDGNNMEPGLRGEILDALDGIDNAEVLTTDTHIVNTVEAENQVGGEIAWDDLIETVVTATERAVADLEPAEVGMATEHAEVTVFGNDRTETLASHANAAVQMGGALAASVIITSLALSALLFFVT